jgi:hypothetical protein
MSSSPVLMISKDKGTPHLPPLNKHNTPTIAPGSGSSVAVLRHTTSEPLVARRCTSFDGSGLDLLTLARPGAGERPPMSTRRTGLVEHLSADVTTESPTQRAREQEGARLWLRFSTSFGPAAELAAGEFGQCVS